MPKVKAGAVLFVLSFLMVIPHKAWSQSAVSFPTKTINLIVPFPPGASTDLLARYLALKLRDALGQPVIVENRPGAGSTLGATYVAKSPPDGHTLLIASSAVMQSHLIQKAPTYDSIRDFAPIAAAFQHPFVVLTGTSAHAPAQNIKDMIAYAKANSGKLNFATVGGFADLLIEIIKKDAGINMQIVPYRGASEATLGVIRGESDMTINSYAAVQGQVDSGQLRILAVTSLQRHEAIPDVPTLAESGLPGFEVINVIGVLAPAATPKATLDKLNAEIGRILKTPETRQFITSRRYDVVDDVSPGYYAGQIKGETERFSKVIQEIGYQKQ
jgi:tripartite-type tricarboxylate transporter receptor subunit TctC